MDKKATEANLALVDHISVVLFTAKRIHDVEDSRPFWCKHELGYFNTPFSTVVKTLCNVVFKQPLRYYEQRSSIKCLC